MPVFYFTYQNLKLYWRIRVIFVPLLKRLSLF